MGSFLKRRFWRPEGLNHDAMRKIALEHTESDSNNSVTRPPVPRRAPRVRAEGGTPRCFSPCGGAPRTRNEGSYQSSVYRQGKLVSLLPERRCPSLGMKAHAVSRTLKPQETSRNNWQFAALVRPTESALRPRSVFHSDSGGRYGGSSSGVMADKEVSALTRCMNTQQKKNGEVISMVRELLSFEARQDAGGACLSCPLQASMPKAFTALPLIVTAVLSLLSSRQCLHDALHHLPSPKNIGKP